MSPHRLTSRSRRRRAGLALGLAALLVVAVAGPAAWAQDGEAPLAPPELLRIDAGEAPALVVRSENPPADVEILVGGEPAISGAPRALAADGERVSTMIVVDTGAEAAAYLDTFVAAAIEYVRLAPSDERIGVSSTGGAPQLRIGLTDAHDRVISVLDALPSAAGPSLLWDTVKDAAGELEGGLAGATNLIVFAGSADGGSATTPAAARGAAMSAHASSFVVAVDDPLVPAGSLSRLVAATGGGGFAQTGDPEVLAAYGRSVSEVVNGTWKIPFESDRLAESNQLTVVIDGTTIEASYVPGAVTSGAALAPFVDTSSGSLIPFVDKGLLKAIGIVAAAVAIGLGAYALVLLTQKDPNGIDDVLRAYTAVGTPDLPEVDDESHGLSRLLLFRRAVELTEGFAERRGLLERTEAMLERADLPLRAGEAFTAYAGIIGASAFFGLLLGRSALSALIFAAFGVLAPPAILNYLAGRRRKAFLALLPDTLQLLSSTLKAGYSFMQGVEAVAQEVDEPMAGELRRVVTEAQLGRPLEEALDASAERMDSPDFAWAVMAVKIQREVGGNLAELLLTVAETMTARERLRRDVAALTAEGKMSAIVLGALPILLGAAMFAINPDYISTLFVESLGKVLLVASVVSAIIGFAWMKKIIDIDI
ncbi:MAG: hypothetical protein D6683_13130 [Actinomyces sp.]|nr:MAG: hypothetical protein D6683_13130 [Actinomyces sp.]